jgi:hypothetical protein
MSRSQPVFCLSAAAIFGAFIFIALPEPATAQSPPPPDPAIKFFAVTLPDTTLSYPNNLPALADEHTVARRGARPPQAQRQGVLRGWLRHR